MLTQKISDYQEWNGKKLYFEPDSSPEAWKHYKKYYTSDILRETYDFENLCFYNCYKKLNFKTGYYNGQKWLNYVDLPKEYCSKKLSKKDYNRIFAIEKGVNSFVKDGIKYVAPANRLGGDCDFNFNEHKVELFGNIFGKENAQLNRCAKMHHTLLNFSLMEAMGGMQCVKGSDTYDRFDVFILRLYEYFSGDNKKVLDEAKSAGNRSALEQYLEMFKQEDAKKSIYYYFETIYFIDDHKFVDKILEQGALDIEDSNDVARYMDLAEEFWFKKEQKLLKREFLTIGSYFPDGSETYTKDELLEKLENDLGFDKETGINFVERCEELGFVSKTDNNSYTR